MDTGQAPDRLRIAVGLPVPIVIGSCEMYSLQRVSRIGVSAISCVYSRAGEYITHQARRCQRGLIKP